MPQIALPNVAEREPFPQDENHKKNASNHTIRGIFLKDVITISLS